MSQKSTETEKRRDGIRLSGFYIAAALIFAVLTFFLLFSTYRTSEGFSQTEEATEEYITAQQAASNIQAASDYLTSQARVFAATGEVSHAENFFEEVNVTRRRDLALETIRNYMSGTSTLSYLSDALENSNHLLEIECYAMRLAAESYGLDLSSLPKGCAQVTLDDADLALSAEQQRDKALLMLFDDTYQGYKDEIRRCVSQSVEVLIGEMRQGQEDSLKELQRRIYREGFLIVVMLLAALILIAFNILFVSHPLRRFVSHIRADETLPEKGASELRFLARTYNKTREQNLRRREQLNYDATHDALTGVFNRSVFEKLRSRLSERENALLIIDLDKFKTINDRYGHDVGDRALCRVASLLQERFRAEDYICRIGGDEFAVIMVHADSSLGELVKEKIRGINETLNIPQDGLPPMSLSVGVAFGDRGNPTEDVFKDADTALYRTKSVRTGGCEIY